MFKNILLLVLSLVLLIFTSNLLLKEFRFLMSSETAEALVENIECSYSMPKRFLGNIKSCLAKVSFVDTDGNNHLSGYNLTLYGFSKDSDLIGSKLDVIYDPLDPKNVQAGMGPKEIFMTLIFPLSSLILLIVTVLKIRKEFKSRSSRK